MLLLQARRKRHNFVSEGDCPDRDAAFFWDTVLTRIPILQEDERVCTDVCCCVFYVVVLVIWLCVAGIAFYYGNPYAILYGTDHAVSTFSKST